MQSATFLLGLMPTVLSYIGPTVAEVTLLSSYRPILIVLLVPGMLAVFLTRPFTLSNAKESLNKDAGTLVLGRRTRNMTIMISVIQYLTILLAATNTITNFALPGTSTILSWRCQSPYMDMAWNLAALDSHLCAGVSMRYSKASHCFLFVSMIPFYLPEVYFLL